jgi:CubicO group peptidase (beta-lactamase class C family)
MELEISGICDERFTKIREVLEANLRAGEDVGASVAVDVAGEMVVDLWGGWVDEEHSAPWAADTITNVWSTTKTMAALCLLMLVDRGDVNLDAPVATYWPEFAANGKEQVLVRHIMSHTSGLSGWDQPVSVDDLYDWDKSTAMLAAQAPWWTPGSASGYHAISQGHLIGEVVRRVTGLSLGTFFSDVVTTPLGADFHIGLPESEFDRVSNVIPPPAVDLDLSNIDPESVGIKTFSGPMLPGAQVSWTTPWRTAEIPAANGHGNARAVARIQSVVANGGSAHGLSLLSPETVDRIFSVQASGVDQVLGMPVTMGIGYGIADPATMPFFPGGRICYWGGWGGSLIIVDVDRQMTIAYMMNKMQAGLVGDQRSAALVMAAYEAIGVNF